jgi:Fe2+ or Zn2+ uptake regulation protein
MTHYDTRHRKAILTVLRNDCRHLTADEVHEEVRKSIPHISKGTVYRNLKLLREQGEIFELELAGAAARFEARTQRHSHFVCERCGGVFDLDTPCDTELDGCVEASTGYHVDYHNLEFHGLCPDCWVKETIEREEHS